MQVSHSLYERLKNTSTTDLQDFPTLGIGLVLYLQKCSCRLIPSQTKVCGFGQQQEAINCMRVYLDNAATTAVDAQVVEAMLPFYTQNFGNPSSIHSHGREARAAVEKARKTVAGLLNTSPSQIFFTSSGTEADNTAIAGAVKAYNVKHIISSAIEHHAVLHTVEHLAKTGGVQLHFVPLDARGAVKTDELEKLLQQYPEALVSLMHGNNEIGNLLDLEAIGDICEKYNAIFHSDTVQTLGHYRHNLQKLKTDFIVGSAHKFHGPKGVGILYIKEGRKIGPFIHGGSQERNMRGGTENIAGIAGLAKALEISYECMEADQRYILSLKTEMMDRLKEAVPGVAFNGMSSETGKSLYTVLSASFPKTDIAEMLLFNLDINKISVSGGSACTSGSSIGSHVLNALYGPEDERPAVRFSFCKHNTLDEVHYVVEKLKQMFS